MVTIPIILIIISILFIILFFILGLLLGTVYLCPKKEKPNKNCPIEKEEPTCSNQINLPYKECKKTDNNDIV